MLVFVFVFAVHFAVPAGCLFAFAASPFTHPCRGGAGRLLFVLFFREKTRRCAAVSPPPLSLAQS